MDHDRELLSELKKEAVPDGFGRKGGSGTRTQYSRANRNHDWAMSSQLKRSCSFRVMDAIC